MKKILATGFLFVILFSFSGCFKSELDKAAEVAAAVTCLTFNAMGEMMAALNDPEKMEMMGIEIEAKREKIIEDAGYENVEEFSKLVVDFDQEKFDEKVMEYVRKDCPGAEEMANSMGEI